MDYQLAEKNARGLLTLALTEPRPAHRAAYASEAIRLLESVIDSAEPYDLAVPARLNWARATFRGAREKLPNQTPTSFTISQINRHSTIYEALLVADIHSLLDAYWRNVTRIGPSTLHVSAEARVPLEKLVAKERELYDLLADPHELAELGDYIQSHEQVLGRLRRA